MLFHHEMHRPISMASDEEHPARVELAAAA